VRGLAAQPDLEAQSAEEVLADAIERFHPRLALACSFQKEESVLLHMLMRLRPDARVFTIDTGVLFDETRETWRAVEERYGVRVEVFDALDPDGEPWTAEHCCSVEKVAALERALGGLDAWITGLRREQGPTRAGTETVDVDARRGGIAKYSPLAHWSERDLWTRIHERGLPYHPLHDEGYESIGCAPCTQPGSGREGRWSGTDKTECGLHLS
jgi:phosphoadenosine phosphosulfate reductase